METAGRDSFQGAPKTSGEGWGQGLGSWQELGVGVGERRLARQGASHESKVSL